VAGPASVEPHFLAQTGSSQGTTNFRYFLEMKRKTSSFFRKLTARGQIYRVAGKRAPVAGLMTVWTAQSSIAATMISSN
jgi:hypothetical protein